MKLYKFNTTRKNLKNIHIDAKTFVEDFIEDEANPLSTFTMFFIEQNCIIYIFINMIYKLKTNII